MEYKEYMDTLGEQIRDSRARRTVLREIRTHIEEQCGAYEAEGMGHEAAMAESIRQMGDPVETGAELNRIHRPRISWSLIGVAVALTIVGILIQWIIFYEIADLFSWTNVWQYYGRNTIIYNLVGLAVMLGIMYLDYSFVGRRAYLWYGLYMVGLLWIHFWPLPYNQLQRTWYFMVSLYPLALAGLIYRNRRQGMKGLLRCMALTAAVLVCNLGNTSSAYLEMLAVSGVLLLLAVAKDIFGGRKLWSNLVLIGTTLAGVLLFLWNIVTDGGWFGENLRRRFLHFLNFGEAPGEAGYLAQRQKQMMASCTLWGGGQFSDFTAESGETGLLLADDYVLSAVFVRFGILIGILVVGALLFFAGRALYISLRQKNRLGLLLGTACGLNLLVHTLAFLAINVGWAFYYTTGIPFLAYGLGYALTNGLQVGLLLCVCRNSAILGEETGQKAEGLLLGKHRYRLRIERLPEEN